MLAADTVTIDTSYESVRVKPSIKIHRNKLQNSAICQNYALEI